MDHEPGLNIARMPTTTAVAATAPRARGKNRLRGHRVVNTTILIAPNTDTQIPVSCSEQGRWQEVSDRFADSGVIAPPSIRATKAESVGRSLRDGSRTSDQSAVWSAIDDIALKAGTQRETGAMRDVYVERHEDLERIASQISMVENQVGGIALVADHDNRLDLVGVGAQSFFCRSVEYHLT